MEKHTTKPQEKVAVVGTGMAGLATAHLLHRDPQKRYQVKVFEKRDQISLSAESISIPSPHDQKKPIWADVPMRAFAGGFYDNLMRMYDYLGVRYHSQPFLFSFTRQPRQLAPSPPTANRGPYMVYASNFHQLPPIPQTSDIVDWLLEAAYALLCYLWFTICCFWIAPLGDANSGSSESLDEYLRRIRLPRYHVDNYLLPLISSVCTCSHEELLQFPASDVLEYKRQTHRQRHFVVADGVHAAQEALLRGLDVQLGVQLTRVEPQSHGGVAVTYRKGESDTNETTELFDRVVLAVSPDIVAKVFPQLELQLGQIPTTTVETVAHMDFSTVPPMLRGAKQQWQPQNTTPDIGLFKTNSRSNSARPQNIHLRSTDTLTESIHEQSNSILVTTNPVVPIQRSKIIQSATFTRVLRSPASRQVVNEIFAPAPSKSATSGASANCERAWRSGDGGIYLAGGWCWDGMVLLEGCIVSAMRVATELGVEIPWARKE